MSESEKKSWLEYEHPHFAAHKDRVKYARDVYSAELLKPENINGYLKQRPIGEANESFEERRDLADFDPHFAHVVDAFVGMVANVESDANRVYADPRDKTLTLGSPTDASTLIGQLFQHADGKGRGLLGALDELATELCIAHEGWCLASSAGESRQPHFQILPFERVPNWLHNGEELVEVLVEEEVDTRGSLRDKPGARRQFMVYRHNQWERYLLNVETKEETLLGRGAYQGFIAPDGSKALPVWPIQVNMKRPAGYLMARKNVAIFNQASTLDHLLRTCGHPTFVFCGNAADFGKAKLDKGRGINFMHLPADAAHAHYYLAPPSEPATILKGVVEGKIKTFHATAGKEYGDSARQERTATEARQDVSQGSNAFLHHKALALDAAENGCYWRAAQIVYPNDRRLWYLGNVKRSENFVPQDGDAVATSQQSRVFGSDKPVPLGINAQVAAALNIAELQGLPADEVQSRAAIGVRELTTLLAVAPDFPSPPALKRYLLTMQLIAGGQIESEKAAQLLSKIDWAAVLDAVEEGARRGELLRERELQNFPPQEDPKEDPEKELEDDPVPAGGGAE